MGQMVSTARQNVAKQLTPKNLREGLRRLREIAVQPGLVTRKEILLAIAFLSLLIPTLYLLGPSAGNGNKVDPEFLGLSDAEELLRQLQALPEEEIMPIPPHVAENMAPLAEQIEEEYVSVSSSEGEEEDDAGFLLDSYYSDEETEQNFKEEEEEEEEFFDCFEALFAMRADPIDDSLLMDSSGSEEEAEQVSSENEAGASDEEIHAASAYPGQFFGRGARGSRLAAKASPLSQALASGDADAINRAVMSSPGKLLKKLPKDSLQQLSGLLNATP